MLTYIKSLDLQIKFIKSTVRSISKKWQEKYKNRKKLVIKKQNKFKDKLNKKHGITVIF